MLLFLLLCCAPSPQAPAEAAKQAARAAPRRAPPYQGAWTAHLFGEAPRLADALRLRPESGFPALNPGQLGILYLPAESSLEGRVATGEWVAVIGPGSEEWRTKAAETLPWAGFGVVDPLAELAAWADPKGPSAGLAEVLAARVIASHYHLPGLNRAAGNFPAGLSQWLWGAGPGDLVAEDPRVRSEAVRAGPVSPGELQRLADDGESVVRLAVAMTSSDPAVLAKLANDPEPWVRARVADQSQDPVVLGTLTRDDSSLVRVVAAHRLAHLDQPAAQGFLEQAAHSGDAYVRWKAARGLRNVELLATLLNSDPDIDVRRAAALSLGRLTRMAPLPATAVKALIDGSQSSNSFVRRWCVEAMGGVGRVEVEAAIRRAATDPTALVAQSAARVLQNWGIVTSPPPFKPGAPPRDAAEIAERASSPDATVRKDLCKFLAGTGNLEVLRRLAADSDSEVRKSAVEAMGWGPEATADLEAALRDSDPDVQVTALDGLRRSRGGNAAALLPLLASTDTEIRLRAVEALAVLPSPDPALEAAAHDPDERIRAAAVRALPSSLRPDEPSALVRHAAGHPTDALSGVARDADMPFWLQGVYAREDDLLHERLSWNDPNDRPDAYDALRPPVIREYGHPDRG